jgi:hypothetical protein
LKESLKMTKEYESQGAPAGDHPIDLRKEVEGLLDCLVRGDKRASVHLARLVQADTKGALQPFADALYARLSDHLSRYAETGVVDPDKTLEDEVYGLLQKTAIDWDGFPKTGRPGEEA